MKYLKKQDFLADTEHRGLVLVSFSGTGLIT